MKRKMCLGVMACLSSAIALTSCTSKEKLYLFNVGEYIDPDLLSDFEDEYNCKVVYTTYDSNELALTKMQTQSFDLVVLSDYAIEQASTSGMIQEFDWSQVEKYSKEDVQTDLKSYLSRLKSEGFDLLNYGLPYFLGNVGICYNQNKITKEQLEQEEWSIFANSKYVNKTAYYESSRDGFMPALKTLGYSMNTTSTAEVDLAYNWLTNMKKSTKPSFLTDDLLSDMPQGLYDLALMYSGDALYSIKEEDKGVDLAYYTPSCGTNVWCDAFTIPTNCKNEELAYKFVSFISRTENALMNSDYVGYTTSNQKAYEILTCDPNGAEAKKYQEQLGSDFEEVIGSYFEYLEYYQIPYRENDEMFRYNKEMKSYMATKWTSLKNE